MSATSQELSQLTLADHVPGPVQGNWTYDDYAALNDGRRYEIVNGVLLMTPAPSTGHQRIVGRFFRYLSEHIEDTGLGLVFQGPTDVELAPKVVVQPDIFVILNAGLHKVAEQRIIGAPDFVVEVTSPSTAIYDRLSKYDTYARAGVQEYWIVNSTARSIEVLALEGASYVSLGVFRGQEIPHSRVASGLQVRTRDYFPQS